MTCHVLEPGSSPFISSTFCTTHIENVGTRRGLIVVIVKRDGLKLTLSENSHGFLVGHTVEKLLVSR